MQLCERLIVTCNSSSSSPTGKTLLPAFLRVLDHHHSTSCRLLQTSQESISPSSTSQSSLLDLLMSLPSVLLSPTKPRTFCSSTVASPARPAPPCNMPVSSAGSAPSSATKRRLVALQHSSIITGLPGTTVGASGVADAAGLGRTAKRLEVASCSLLQQQHHAAAGLPAVAAAAGPAAQPVTPAISQPQPLALTALGISREAASHHHMRAGHSAVAAAAADQSGAVSRMSRQLSACPLAGAIAAASISGGCAAEHDYDSGPASGSDQLPSPTAILDFPPELMAAAGSAHQQEQPSAALSGAQQHQHKHHASSQHPQQQQPQQHHVHTMSGQRLSQRYDIPVGLDWLNGLPNHVPQLGEGRLEVIVGPMFAGKTTALINRVKEVSGAEGKVHVAVKSAKDARYSAHWVVSHDGRCMRCYTADSLAQFKTMMGPAYHKLQVLAIDEAQFFPDLIEFCEEAVDVDGKHVIVSGLSGDFRRRRFGQVLDLLPMADSVTQLTSKCGFCDSNALFSLRLVKSGAQEVVGGDESYRPTCRRCYLLRTNGMQ